MSISVLAGGREILHQNRGKDADDAVELPLPETVVLVGLPAQNADDGAFWKRQLVIRLSRVVVQGLRERHCNRGGRAVKSRTKQEVLPVFEVTLTAGVSVDGAGWELGFGLSGVAGGVGSGVQRSQGLQHAQQAVGGRQLQVFLWDVAHLSTAVSGLEQR